MTFVKADKGYAPTKAYVIALQHLGGWTARNMMLAISMANLTTLATASARMVVHV